MMASEYLLPAYDALLEYLVENATPEAILAFKISDEEQDYAHRLLDRNNAGTLSLREHQQLEQMAELDSLLSILKAKALAVLSEQE